MNLPEPQMRAIQAQSLLRAIVRLGEREYEEIRALAGAETLGLIENVLPVVWIPMRHHMRFCDAVRDVVGPERNVELWRTTMTMSFDRPLLRGFVRMSTELFGTTPLSLLKQGDRIYRHITRDLGTLSFTPAKSAGAGSVVLQEFPADRYRFACYVEGLAGCLLSVFTLCATTGTVTVTERDNARGDVSYGLRWAVRPSASDSSAAHRSSGSR